MKLPLKELELTSLDRLKLLKERVSFSVNEYKRIFNGLINSFNKNDLESIANMQKLEHEAISTIINRIKIYTSHRVTLEKNGIMIPKDLLGIDELIKDLYEFIEINTNKLRFDANTLNTEVTNVKEQLRHLIGNRDITSQRIDIIV